MFHYLSPGGKEIQVESSTYVTKYGPVQTGHLFMGKVTGALKCHAIAHAVGPVWNKDNRKKQEVCRNQLHCLIGRILSAVETKNMSSIAIPAISTGIFQFPIKQATDIICNAVIDYLENYTDTTIREIHFIDNNLHTVEHFRNSLCEVLDQYSEQ